MNKINIKDYTDRPIDSKEKDWLGYSEGIVEDIYNLIFESSWQSGTISVSGEWGCGKTSILNLIENKFNSGNNKTNILIKFDAIRECNFSFEQMKKRMLTELHGCLDLKTMNNVNGSVILSV